MQNSFGEKEKRVRVRVWASCVRVEKIVNKFEIFSISIESYVKCVEEWNIWQSNKNQRSYTIWTINGKFTSNSQVLQSKPLFDWLFTELVFSIKTHQILIKIKWDLFHCVLEEKSFHMNSSWFFWVFVKISSSVHGFGVVQPMFTKFDSLRNYDLHQDCESSSRIIHMHTQAFRKISQLVNFKLFPWHFHLPSSLQLVDFWKIVKWVILIQIRLCQFIWLLGGKKKRW